MYAFFISSLLLGAAWANVEVSQRVPERPTMQEGFLGKNQFGISDPKKTGLDITPLYEKQKQLDVTSSKKQPVQGGKGTVVPHKQEPKVLIPAPADTGTSEAAQQEMPVVMKTCDDKVVLLPGGTSKDMLNVVDTPRDGKCVSPLGGTTGIKVLGSTSEVLRNLQQGLLYWDTRLKAELDRLPGTEREIADAVVRYHMSEDRLKGGDFFARVEPEIVRLMFNLSYLAYYNKKLKDFTPNQVSISYQQEVAKLKGEIGALDNRISNVRKFRDELSKVFGPDTIRYVEQRRLERQEESDVRHQDVSVSEGRYDQKFGMHTESKPGDMSFEQSYGGHTYGAGQVAGQAKGAVDRTETETMDFKVRTLAPELIHAQAVAFNRMFKDPDTKIEDLDNVTLEDIESRLGTIESRAQHAKIEKQRALEILSDPVAAEYWAKVDHLFNRHLEGFKPVMMFYRNIGDPYKLPLIGASLAEAKANIKTRIDDNREVSGVMLYREGDSSQDKKKIDQLIVAFSGSNSTEDWKHNFAIKRSAGVARHDGLAAGYKVHQGILDSLDESLTYAGTNLAQWFRDYARAHPVAPDGTKPTLRIAVTGHSLGGGLALLMSLYIKDRIAPNYEDRINIEVVAYTFAAPPIFQKDKGFAKKAEDRLGKQNIIRVWNEGDPVSTLSIVLKNENIFKRSLLMLLLGYDHIGLSIPLFDQEGIASFFDKLNPWSNHLSGHYSNLLETNFKALLDRKAQEIDRYLQSHDLLKGEMIKNSLQDMNDMLRSSQKASMVLSPQVKDEIIKIATTFSDARSQAKRTIEHHDAVREEGYRRGIVKQPKLAKADTSGLSYTHRFVTGQEVPIKLTRRTPCDLSSLAKANKLNTKLFDRNDLNELSCGCCLSKNYFVSMDGSVTAKFRGLLGKKISTVDEVYQHCSKYCSPLVGVLFTSKSRADINEIGRLMERMGMGEMWKKKKLQ